MYILLTKFLRSERQVLSKFSFYNLLDYELLKSKIFWGVLISLMFVPMIITFIFSDDYIPILQSALQSWRFRSDNLILSDILFYEAGFFLIFGAMLAGAVLFLAWKPDRLALFVEPVFRWTIIEKEREIPAALLLGLLLIAMGIIYISTSVIVMFQEIFKVK